MRTAPQIKPTVDRFSPLPNARTKRARWTPFFSLIQSSTHQPFTFGRRRGSFSSSCSNKSSSQSFSKGWLELSGYYFTSPLDELLVEEPISIASTIAKPRDIMAVALQTAIGLKDSL